MTATPQYPQRGGPRSRCQRPGSGPCSRAYCPRAIGSTDRLSPASDYVPSWSVELICRALVLHAPDIAILLAGRFRAQGERHGTNV